MYLPLLVALSWSNSTLLDSAQWSITSRSWVQLKLATLKLNGSFLDAYLPWFSCTPTWLAGPSPSSMTTIPWSTFILSPNSHNSRYNGWMSFPSLIWPLLILWAYSILLLILYLRFMNLELALLWWKYSKGYQAASYYCSKMSTEAKLEASTELWEGGFRSNI